MDHAAHSTVETLQKSYTYVHQIALSQPCNGRMIIDVIQIFFASSQGGIDPPNQNPVDALEQPAKQNDYMCVWAVHGLDESITNSVFAPTKLYL